MLELFTELQREFGFASLFISHDLAVVDLLADRIAVLYKGELVEEEREPRCLVTPRIPTPRGSWRRFPYPTPSSRRTGVRRCTG